MLNDVEDIVICNFRYDRDMRSEVYLPTLISGVTVYHSAGVKPSGRQGGESRADNLNYKVRIPLSAVIEDGRTYIRSAEYEKMPRKEAARHWTIQSNCYVILGAVEDERSLTDYPGVQACGNDFFEVIDYSDNTRRGSEAVKHWRIGGS